MPFQGTIEEWIREYLRTTYPEQYKEYLNANPASK